MEVLKVVAVLFFMMLLSVEGDVDAAACNTIGLAPCLTYVQKGGENKTPSPACCSNVKKFSPSCLCASVQSNLAKQYKVDIQTALSVPKRCNIKFNVPPDYTCAGYSVPKDKMN